MRQAFVRIVLFSAFVATACGTSPSGAPAATTSTVADASTTASDTSAQQTDSGAAEPGRLDVLLVVPSGPGMCFIQTSLSDHLDVLWDTLAASGITDVQLAVTSASQMPTVGAWLPIPGHFQTGAPAALATTCAAAQPAITAQTTCTASETPAPVHASVTKNPKLRAEARCSVRLNEPPTGPIAGGHGPLRAVWQALRSDGPHCLKAACDKASRACCNTELWCKSDYNEPLCDDHKDSHCAPLGKPQPPSCQAVRLLRDGVPLLIVFVATQDDCSVAWTADGKPLNPLDPGHITAEQRETCQLQGDAEATNEALNEGNCLHKQAKGKDAAIKVDIWCPTDCRPNSDEITIQGASKCPDGCKEGSAAHTKCQQTVTEHQPKSRITSPLFATPAVWRTKLNGLKSGPGDVHIAVIAGDSTRTIASDRQAERAAYYRAALTNQGAGKAPAICEPTWGKVALAGRFRGLVDAFKEQGLFINICQQTALDQPLRAIGKWIAGRIEAQK